MFEDRSDENPLAGLGSTSAATASVSAAPASVGGDVPRRRWSETPLVLLWALLTLAIGAWVLQRAEHAAVHDPVQRAARGHVGDARHESLVRPANAAHVLRALRGAMRQGETLTSLRLDPAKAGAISLNMFVTGTSQADHRWMADIHGRRLHRPGEPEPANGR